MNHVIRDTHGRGLDALLARFAPGKHIVKVGIPAGIPKEERVSAGSAETKEADVSLAYTAAVNEFGSEEAGIPERPAFRTGLRKGARNRVRLNRINLVRISRGELTLPQALGQLGAMGVGQIVNEINNGHYAPNAESTIAKKGSDRPLKDTGQEAQAITWVVPEGGRA